MATLGKTTFGATRFAVAADQKHVCRATLSEGALVTKLSLDIARNRDTSWLGQTVKCVIYADDGAGHPGVKVLETAQQTIGSSYVAHVWVDFTCATTYLPPGTYWLGFIAGSINGQAECFYDAGGLRYYNADTYSDGAAAAFGATSGGDSITFPIYATYTPAAVGRSLALPDTLLSPVARSVALPYIKVPQAGRTTSLPWVLDGIVTKSVSFPFTVIAQRGRSLAYLYAVAQAAVARSLVFRYGVGAQAAIPGRSNADTYLGGAANPFGSGTIETTDLSIYATFFKAWRPPSQNGLDLARLDYPDAQANLAASGALRRSQRPARLGWHGMAFDPERGSVALVQHGGKLADLVGQRVQIKYGPPVAPRVIFAYVTQAVDLGFDDEDISVPRRLFLALSPLRLDEIPVAVEALA